ncbi:HEAT repeat domain-containing protein [Runella sp. MFBS21]|uniref:HEAT repeat domain-containing protein n=1 Tax=Runella sp. MFBS21 TaxID=3034018 RepID=UPI0023F8871D|nr:HEAT repeat domain-containing protein [Runella sp. MFBS21]MDF7815999.1 HEAT repeat domain-containing protein [Runella sp. MFBS21]
MKKEAKLMNCEESKQRLTGWLNHQLTESEQEALNKHLIECPDCQREFETDRQLWQLMGKVTIPQPTEHLREGFYAMLNHFKETEAPKKTNVWQEFIQKWQRFWTPQLALRLAYSICLISIGLLGGYWLTRPKEMAYQEQLDTLTKEVQDMRQMMMLSLIENPSASERLRAVSYTKEINEIDSRVLEALFTTLNNDPNVNVRLVTLEALAQMAKDPHVREGLVQSLPQQESPLVQVALADLMVKLQEKRSIRAFKQMLRRDDLNDLVKTKIQQTIKDLS